jgi:hypothetical protein
MLNLRILCTDVHSESAARIAVALEKRLGYKVFRSDKVIPNRQHIRYGDGRDKLHQYKFFRKNNLNFPWFSESKEIVTQMMQNGAIKAVLCRVLLQGQEGHGIVIADNSAELVDAPVYVQYQEKTLEYRVNLFRGKVVNVREKRRKNGFDGGEPRIRNVENGYVYCIPRGRIPPDVLTTAIQASRVTDSDVVGVDVAYNADNDEHFIIEVNSAPSLEGVTVEDYAAAIINEFKED